MYIDITTYFRSIPPFVDFSKPCHLTTFTAFKLKDRVPLGALSCYWMDGRINYDLCTNDRYKLVKSRTFPHGINYDFINNDYIINKIYSKHFDKADECISYKTMKLMHEVGFIAYETEYDNTPNRITYTGHFDYHMNTFCNVYKNNTLVGFATIPLDTYITLLHLFNINHVNAEGHPYLVKEDYDKMKISMDDIQFVFHLSTMRDAEDLIKRFCRNYFDDEIAMDSIKITYTDDIYHNITERTITKQDNKLFTYARKSL